MKHQLSVSSEDGEDDVAALLPANCMSEERLKMFKAASWRIRKRIQAQSSTGDGNFCAKCSVVSIEDIRTGYFIADSFAGLKASSKGCQLCRLVLIACVTSCLRLMQNVTMMDASNENSRSLSMRMVALIQRIFILKFKTRSGYLCMRSFGYRWEMPRMVSFESKRVYRR